MIFFAFVVSGQSFPTYLLLFLVYFPLYYWRRSPAKEGGTGRIYERPGQQPLSTVIKKRGLRYFFLAAVDVESNYLTHRALQYTTLTSVEVPNFFLRFKKVGTLYHNLQCSVARKFPANDDETSRVNEGPTPGQLCQGLWPVGHPWAMAELTRRALKSSIPTFMKRRK